MIAQPPGKRVLKLRRIHEGRSRGFIATHYYGVEDNECEIQWLAEFVEILYFGGHRRQTLR